MLYTVIIYEREYNCFVLYVEPYELLFKNNIIRGINMSKKKELKKQILLESFETLKSDIVGNEEGIDKIIQKMLPINEAIAIDLWKYTINNYREFGSYSIVSTYEDLFGMDKLAKLIIDDVALKKEIFGYDSLGYNPLVAHFIDINDLKNANAILELMHNNGNLHNTFGEDLLTIISPYCNNISEDGVEMLSNWADKTSATEKANINVALLDYL